MRKYWCASGNVENDKKWNQVVNQFSSVQSLSHVRLFATPRIAARQPPCPSPTPGVHSDSRPSSQ